MNVIKSFGGLWNKKYVADIQNRTVNLCIKGYLDGKIMFRKISYLETQKYKLPGGVYMRIENSMFHSCP